MWRVTRGIRDSSNRSSLWFQDALPVVAGEKYHATRSRRMPTEHTFKAGHRIVVIVAGTNTSMARRAPPAHRRTPVAASRSTRATEQGHAPGRRRLTPRWPRPGAFTDPTGHRRRHRAGDAGADAGRSGEFGAFTPGIAKEYTAATTATVISTAGDATLTVADPSSDGHRPPGQRHVLPGRAAAGPGRHQDLDRPDLQRVGPVTFKQSIAANEPLRTGTYSKTLTFTLSTTTP